MNKTLRTAMFILLFALSAICQIIEEKQIEKIRHQQCPPNSDSLYDREKVMKQLANILDESIPEIKKYGAQYDVTKDGESPAGFFIYDLSDTSNRDITSTGCIEFINNHIYHFAPFMNHFSLSHIVILENGYLKVFKSINCKDRGDSLEDVMAYLKQKLANDKNKNTILDRVKNYRKYGRYLKMDDYDVPICQSVSDKEK